MKSKIVLGLVILITVFVVSYVFIKSSNDHKECGTVVNTVKDKDGNIVTVSKHNCKEKYNF